MKVCVAEKPSVAREIAEVLGATARKNGYMEGNGYQVTWTFGHLCTLKEPHEYADSWKRWSLGALPMIPPRFGIKLIENPTYEQQFRIIEGLMRDAEMVINCGDAGQEGELIQRWVMLKAGCKCPVYRLWISSLTEEAIREGFQNLREQAAFDKLYEAGLSRAIGDWLLGMNATRLYTLRYGQNRHQAGALLGAEDTLPRHHLLLHEREILAERGRRGLLGESEGTGFHRYRHHEKERTRVRPASLRLDLAASGLQQEIRLHRRRYAETDSSVVREEVDHLSARGHYFPERRHLPEGAEHVERAGGLYGTDRPAPIGRQAAQEQASVRQLEGDRPPRHHPNRRSRPGALGTRATGIRFSDPPLYRRLLSGLRDRYDDRDGPGG